MLHGISGALIISVEQAVARGVDEARICRDFGVTPEQYAAIEKHMREDD